MRYLRTAFIVLMLPIVFPGQGFAAGSQGRPRPLLDSIRIGRAEPSLPMKSMLLAFKLRNELELQQLLEAQQNPVSPSYHQWLTSEEFGNRFGIPERTYQRAAQWLMHHGFSNVHTNPSRLSIYFDGDASLVEEAFRVQVHIYEFRGKRYHSNDRPAEAPSGYQDAILGIVLDDFPAVAPLYRSGSYISMSPRDMRIAYNLTPLYNRGVTGIGQKIAIVARSDFNISDVQDFRSMFGLSANDPQKILVGTSSTNRGGGEEKEVLLDAEWAGAIAPDAVIQVVISPTMDIGQSISYIVNSLPSTHVMSISFGAGESTADSATMNYFMNLFSQAAAQGQTVVVSSGDDGAQQASGSGSTTVRDINFLCSSPNVTCIGGTNINNNFDANGNYIAYAGETAWSLSGGGESTYQSKPYYQYGPGVPSNGWRYAPDVAALASSPNAWIQANGQLVAVGGTSLSAPIWAGVFGLVNQAGSAGGVGNANPRIYELGRDQYQSGGPAVFNDVTLGNNSTSTVTGFNADTAYDQVTGWGSLNADMFVGNFFSSSSGTTTDIKSLSSGVPFSDSIAADPFASPTCGLSQTQYSIDVPAGALQLKVSLDGSADVDLYVRARQPVGETGGSFVADFRSTTSSGSENIYVDPQSTPALVAARYYIGVANCVGTPATFTLTATVVMNSSSPPVISNATATFLSDGSFRLVISGQDPDGDVTSLTETRFDADSHMLGQGSFDISATIGGRTSFVLNFTISSGNRLFDTRLVQIQLGDASGLVSNIVTASVSGSEFFLSVPAGGASVAATSGSTGTVRVSSAIVGIDSGVAPYGTAVFTFNQNGVIVSETGVPASAPTTAARIFIEHRTITTRTSPFDSSTITVNTGVAIVNTGTANATVDYLLRDSGGNRIASGSGTIPVNGHRAAFIDQFSSIASNFAFPTNFPQFGSLDITSTNGQDLSILALRLTTNQRGDTLLTTTPIADLNTGLSAAPLYFPRLADGGGWKTSIVLLNTSSSLETGTLGIFAADGSPLYVRQVGDLVSRPQFTYSINPGGLQIFATDGSAAGVGEGSVQLVPNSGPAPVGAGILGFTQTGVLVSESGIPPATLTTHARIYVDQSEGHMTGIAVANPQGSSMTVSLTAYQSDGVTPATTDSSSLVLNGNGEKAAFTGSLFPDLPAGFTGVLDISASAPFAALTLRALQNSRGDFIITTFPVADLTRTVPTPIVFPHVVDGSSGGLYQTRFIMLGTTGASNVTLKFFGDDGSPLAMSIVEDSAPALYFYADEERSMAPAPNARKTPRY